MLRFSCIYGSDRISGGNQFGSDTFQNGSDIIRYPTAILSPARSVSMRGYQGQKSVFRGRVHISRGTRDIA